MIKRHKWDLAEAQVALVIAMLLHLLVDNRLIFGQKVPIIIFSIALVIAIGIFAIFPHQFSKRLRLILSIILIAVVTISNISSLVLVISSLMDGSSIPGRTILLAALVIFLTNIVIFALWYWEIDSPGLTGWNSKKNTKHFLFTQQNNMNDKRFDNWQPHFVDYLYLSTTNATAFSPTDTMPLTHTAKGLMGLQSLVSLLTLALVAARAINILK